VVSTQSTTRYIGVIFFFFFFFDEFKDVSIGHEMQHVVTSS
jgi:hypothetical protein